MQYRHGTKEGVTDELQGKGLRGLHDPLLSGGRVSESEKYMETAHRLGVDSDPGWKQWRQIKRGRLNGNHLFLKSSTLSLLVRGLILL